MPPLRILFLAKTRENEFRKFTYDDIESLRGAECTVLYLADAMARRGHHVVVGSLPRPGSITHGTVVVADPQTALADKYDVVISNNFARAFNGARATARVIWTHNPGFSWAHVKADYYWKLKHPPFLVHLSRYTRRRSWFLPRSGSTVIHHGLPAGLLDARKARSVAPPPVAVFSSYAGRNLAKVVEAWRDVVHPALPEARLIVTAEVRPKHVAFLAPDELAKLNIEIPGLLPRSQLMDLLRNSRVLVAPGHFQETYNLLSVEAATCGIPVVTMGIGALSERVLHDQTGWVAPSVPEMGRALIRILADDAVWWRYHHSSLSHPDLLSWDDRAAAWEAYLLTEVLKRG